MIESSPQRPTATPPDESLISGYLDGVLSQGEAQKVELWLEESKEFSAVYEELRSIRDAARGTEFVLPTDEQWNEKARTRAGGWWRRVGWTTMVLWAVLLLGHLLWELLGSSGSLLEKFLVLGALAGIGSLLVAVFLDRLGGSTSDRYRRVLK